MTIRPNTEAAKEARRRYNASPQGRASRARYAATARGREVQRRAKAKSNAKNAAKIAEASRRRKRVIADRVNAIKLESGCVDCGYRANPVALDFDHIDTDKRGDVSDLVGSASWRRITAEIAKCEIVCANCHRIRTYERRQHFAQPVVDDNQGKLW